MSRSIEFDKTFPGLQILWEDDGAELEYVGMRCLLGQSNRTATGCKVGRSLWHCRYVVESRREGKVLTLTYTVEPKDYPPGWWDVDTMRGTTTITFESESSCKPLSITWRPFRSGRIYRIRNADWQFLPEAETVVLDPKRSKKLQLRTDRPKQRQLRSLLIAERPNCLVTGTRTEEALEACHIVPVANGGPDSVQNAILLRRDVHALFDAGRLNFVPETDGCRVRLNQLFADGDYEDLKGSPMIPWDRFGIGREVYIKARAGLQR